MKIIAKSYVYVDGVRKTMETAFSESDIRGMIEIAVHNKHRDMDTYLLSYTLDLAFGEK